jgi:hypothetical protein
MIELILKKLSKKVKQGFLSYSLGLILNKEKNVCTKIAEALDIRHDFLYRFLVKAKAFLSFFPSLMLLVVKCFDQSRSWIIIDDTTLLKAFAKKLLGVYTVFNTALGRPDRGLCIVVIAWTNGHVTIPLRFLFYYSKDITGDSFKTKSQLAKELLIKLFEKIPFEALLIDGHYTTQHLIKFLMQSNTNFTGKIARNRVIETKNGLRTRIDNHPSLKLFKNQRQAKVYAKFGGEWLYFSVHKRKNKTGVWTYLYLVSNMNLKSKEYFYHYDMRWNIEPIFRTSKQSLGFQDCESIDIEKQSLHIYSIFFSYAFLQKEKVEYNLKNPETAIKNLSALKTNVAMSRIVAFSQNFDHVA